MADETKVIDVIMGPYRGHRLTVSAADADSAVNSHWATDANAAAAEPGRGTAPAAVGRGTHRRARCRQ